MNYVRHIWYALLFRMVPNAMIDHTSEHSTTVTSYFSICLSSCGATLHAASLLQASSPLLCVCYFPEQTQYAEQHTYVTPICPMTVLLQLCLQLHSSCDYRHVSHLFVRHASRLQYIMTEWSVWLVHNHLETVSYIERRYRVWFFTCNCGQCGFQLLHRLHVQSIGLVYPNVLSDMCSSIVSPMVNMFIPSFGLCNVELFYAEEL